MPERLLEKLTPAGTSRPVRVSAITNRTISHANRTTSPSNGRALCWCKSLVTVPGISPTSALPPSQYAEIHHPRLYFTAADLPQLREPEKSGVHAKIWANMTKSADWCAKQTPRTEWIPTAEKIHSSRTFTTASTPRCTTRPSSNTWHSPRALKPIRRPLL